MFPSSEDAPAPIRIRRGKAIVAIMIAPRKWPINLLASAAVQPIGTLEVKVDAL